MNATRDERTFPVKGRGQIRPYTFKGGLHAAAMGLNGIATALIGINRSLERIAAAMEKEQES